MPHKTSGRIKFAHPPTQNVSLTFCVAMWVWTSPLTISRGNSILVLSCFYKVSKYISGCWPRWNFLWALANTFFVNITIKLYYCEKRWYFKFNLRINDLHQKAHEIPNIRHLNGHLDFSSGFQVIEPWNYEKMLKSRKKPWH